MADISSLLSTLLSGGASSDAPAAPEAPAAPGAGFQALANSSPLTGSTVLARLRGGTGAGANGGIGGIIGGGMGAVKPDSSKLGAFAQGFAGALKAGGEQASARQTQQLELMKALWDRDFKSKTLDETKNAHAALKKYYEDMGSAALKKADKDGKDASDLSSIDNIAKIYRARAEQAKALGLHDTVLGHHARGTGMNSNDFVTPEEKAAAQAELDRRQKLFDDWDKSMPWGKMKLPTPPADNPPTPPPNDDGTPGTATPPADTTGDTTGGTPADVPLPPARPPMFKVSPLESTGPATPATPAPTTTLRPVIGPDGQKHLFDPNTGAIAAVHRRARRSRSSRRIRRLRAFSSPDEQIPGFAG
jgi:hypothetical protein